MQTNEHKLNTPPAKILFTDRSVSLKIRPLEEGDAACIYKAVEETKNNLLPFLDWSHKNWSLEMQAARIRKASDNYYLGNEYELGIFSGTNNEFLMAASWTPGKTQNKKSLEIGYWTHIEHCGKWLATLVSQILVIIAFDFLDCERVEVRCKKENIGSQKVIAKCGFRFEGEIRNYYNQPTKAMIVNGYNPGRNCLQYALIQEGIKKIPWYKGIREKLKIIPKI